MVGGERIQAPLPAPGGRFGSAVAVSGNGEFVVAGAPYYNSNAGRAQLYELDDPWIVLLSVDGDGGSADFAGWSVAINYDGDVVAVGALGYSSNKGCVRVYSSKLTGDGSWDQYGQAPACAEINPSRPLRSEALYRRRLLGARRGERPRLVQ